jgi:hypothetical protein
MTSWLYLLRDLCQLRRGPQDMPYSPPLLVAVCAANLLLQLGIAHLVGVGAGGDTLGAGLIGLALNLGLLYGLLTLRGFANRFVQAALALIGCAIVFSLLSLPVVLATGARALAPETITPLQALLALLAFPIVIWKLVVDAHILRHSLDIPFLGGLVVALLWVVAELVLASALRGPGLGT